MKSYIIMKSIFNRKRVFVWYILRVIIAGWINLYTWIYSKYFILYIILHFKILILLNTKISNYNVKPKKYQTYLHPLYHNHRHNSFHHCHHLYHYVFHLKKCRWHVYLRVVLFLRQLVFRFHLEKHFISMIVKFVFTMKIFRKK